MDEKDLLTLAGRVRSKFRGRFPIGVTAADAFNDAVVLLLELLPQADERRPPDTPLEAWLVTRAHGDLRDRYARLWRGDAAVRAVTPVNPNLGPLCGDGQETADAVVDLRSALDRLQGVERRVMQLHLDGQTQDQIAVILGRTQPYVSQIMQRAKRRLRVLLASYEDTP